MRELFKNNIKFKWIKTKISYCSEISSKKKYCQQKYNLDLDKNFKYKGNLFTINVNIFISSTK
jgi:hypothetical protein